MYGEDFEELGPMLPIGDEDDVLGDVTIDSILTLSAELNKLPSTATDEMVVALVRRVCVRSFEEESHD